MAVKRGAFTSTGTGNVSVTSIGFQPTEVEFYVGGSNAKVQFSIGGYAQNQTVIAVYSDASGGQTKTSTSKCINHMDRVSGAIVDVLVATFVSFDPTGFTLNFSVSTTAYQIQFVARG